MAISQSRLAQLRGLIRSGQQVRFYGWPEWQTVRETVLAADHRECQLCRAAGRYSRGDIVHHVRHLDQRPDLALSVTDPDTGRRQLVTVCKRCHEDQHPDALRQFVPVTAPVTPERWD